jgi:hypothetical protein
MNQNFFYEENKDKYYVLGWILSDGHVSKIKNFWSIQLHLKDKKMLEKILNIIKSDNNIHGPYKDRPSVQIQIVNKEHLTFLTQSWGLDNHKSHNLKWKDCPDEFLPHLVRGYFDGDGSIYTKQSANPNVNTVGINFVGTHNFINGLKIAINKANNLDESTGCISDLDTYATLIYNGSDIALKILDWIYISSTELTRLDRKFEKYLEYKKYIESLTNYDEHNKSTKYGNTIVPDFNLSEQIRFDYKYLDLNITQLSSKYNVNRSTLDGILKNITHVKSDNRTNHSKIYVEAFGENKHILDWADDDRCNVDSGTLRDRIINQKLNPEEAITKLPDSTSGVLKYRYDIDGEFKTISEILKDKGISRSTFTHRVNNLGLSPKEASEKLPGELKGANHAPGKLSNNQKYTQSEIKSARDIYVSEGKTVKEVAQITGISEVVLYNAFAGKTYKDPTYTPQKKKQDTISITYNNKTQSIKEWSNELGIPYSTIDRRYRANLPIDQVMCQEELPKTKTKQSEKDKNSYILAQNLREDYKNGLQGKSLYEKYNVPKSRAMDILANRTCKDENVWWK